MINVAYDFNKPKNIVHTIWKCIKIKYYVVSLLVFIPQKNKHLLICTRFTHILAHTHTQTYVQIQGNSNILCAWWASRLPKREKTRAQVREGGESRVIGAHQGAKSIDYIIENSLVVRIGYWPKCTNYKIMIKRFYAKYYFHKKTFWIANAFIFLKW